MAWWIDSWACWLQRDRTHQRWSCCQTGLKSEIFFFSFLLAGCLAWNTLAVWENMYVELARAIEALLYTVMPCFHLRESEIVTLPLTPKSVVYQSFRECTIWRYPTRCGLFILASGWQGCWQDSAPWLFALTRGSSNPFGQKWADVKSYGLQTLCTFIVVSICCYCTQMIFKGEERKTSQKRQKKIKVTEKREDYRNGNHSTLFVRAGVKHWARPQDIRKNWLKVQGRFRDVERSVPFSSIIASLPVDDSSFISPSSACGFYAHAGNGSDGWCKQRRVM